MVKKSLSVRGNKNGMAGSKGSSMKGILFFLFALAVCFGYFYFFTDVLRPKEETPGQPDVYTSEVKKPLPERLVQTTATSAEEAVSPPPGSAPPAEPSLPGATGEDSPVKGGDVASARKIPKTATDSVKTVTQKHPPVKSDSVPDKKKSKTAESPAKQKKEPAEKTSAALKVAKKPVTPVAKPQVKSVVPKKVVKVEQPVAKKADEAYTLVVGSYILKSSMLADKAKLEKAGLRTHVAKGNVKTATMNRLLVAEAATAVAARQELDKLKKVSKDAFLLRKNGGYAIYAGSYFDGAKALKEQERLQKQGVLSIVKKSEAPVSSYSLSAGGYPTREAALKHADALKKLGFEPYPAPIK